jgi:hypothetical protein
MSSRVLIAHGLWVNLPVPPGPLHWSANADRPLRGRVHYAGGVR